MVYSTCSILQEENHGVVEKFLSQNEGFKVAYEKTILPNEVQDGFFICKLKATN
jgi:16S rRNA C967 or C1407 C5-methylase (RsmB/RsmF family)